MSIEKVTAYFESVGLADQIHIFSESSATVALAAKALGCEEAHIAKSLSFMVNEKPIIIVAAGDMKIDNPKFKAQFGTKAKMLSPQQTLDLIGHPVGGVCPFAVHDGVDIYLDESLKRFSLVYPACGNANSAIGLTIPQLETHSKAIGWINVCKAKEA